MCWIKSSSEHTCVLCLFLVVVHLTLAIEGAAGPHPHLEVVNISSLLPKPYCQTTFPSGPAIGSGRLKIISRFGPCNGGGISPSFEQSNNREDAKGAAVYTVNVGLGTPQQQFQLILDTGSNETWVQCPSRYDPSKSSTYTNSTDSFDLKYEDGSSAYGFIGYDTLTLADYGKTKNFRFGCAHKYIDPVDDNKIDGILALGTGSALLSTMRLKMFSYCTPITSSQMGNLYFGNDARTKVYQQFTPLLIDSYYYVELVGISVADKRFNLPTAISKTSIIDSGTIITRLPVDVYSALRDAFKLYSNMSRHTLLENYHKLMDTCYRLDDESKSIVLPKIRFHFGQGTDITLNKNGILWNDPHDKGVVCLAFAAPDDKIIIGNVQTRGYNLLYDLEGKRIGFGQCA